MKNVTAAIIIQGNKVFIARRAPYEKHPGSWEFPGGKVENGESPEDCLYRELFEEFCIESQVKGLFAESFYQYPTGAIRLLAYFVEIIDGSFVLSVHDDYAWVEYKDLLKYDLLPADIPIAQKLMEAF